MIPELLTFPVHCGWFYGCDRAGREPRVGLATLRIIEANLGLGCLGERGIEIVSLSPGVAPLLTGYALLMARCGAS